MNNIETRIIDFISEHHIFTLATSYNNQPYTSTCFYVYIAELNMFVFTSDITTKHITDAINQPFVAGAIALETSIIGKIRGIQFTGFIKKLEKKELSEAKKAYIIRFPIALLAKTTLWGITPNYIKMTDNRLGFGKKIIWESPN
ncbi:MAG: pyridoxamine 5'-phosphate oxidase family protein [Bacteroidetes bacterium]|nr:pyridoxamine 5'-phosphate oxidase family protein [Bacteroidota bacterium]